MSLHSSSSGTCGKRTEEAITNEWTDLLDDEVIMRTHSATDGSHEHAVPGQEGQQTGSIPDDLPWVRHDAEDGYNQSGAEDINVLRGKAGDWFTTSVPVLRNIAVANLLSLENGYVPAAIWLPMVANMKLNAVKNFAARESNLAITAGMYHSKSPQI
jgi:hypothetical protein